MGNSFKISWENKKIIFDYVGFFQYYGKIGQVAFTRR